MSRIFIICFLFPFSLIAQVGIGTTSPNSSTILDVSAIDKGVSFPNINLSSETDNTTISSPIPGLMVYNTNSSLPCGKGLYYNNGTAIAPIWVCFTKTIKQYHAYNSATRSGVTSTTLTLQPGCTINFVIPTGQVADIKIDGVLGALNTNTSTGRYSVIDVVVYVDGAPLPQGGWNRTSIINPSGTATNSFNVCSFSTQWNNVSSGSHTIQLYSSRVAGSTSVDIGGDCAVDTNCGELHAMILYK